MSENRGPLQGVRVVDVSSSYAAPTTSMYLGDMGADVIKVEPIWGDDARGWGPPFLNGEAAWFLSVNRNKKSLCLDIRSDKGREILFRLLETADVFIENLNPAKLEKHGLGLDGLRERFSHLVICAVSGFGLDGPDASLPGYDLIAQARSGLMSVTGVDDVPQRVSTALSDVAAGTVAAFAVASALVRQRTTGRGEIVDIALLEADLAFMAPRIAGFLAGGEEPRPCGGTDSVIAVYQSFPTADRSIVIALGNDRLWQRACRALGLHELAADQDLATNAQRRGRRSEVVEAFAGALAEMTSEMALKALQLAGVPCAPINYLSEVVADPQVVARQAIVEQHHPVAGRFQSVAAPWRLGSNEPREPRLPAPLLGQHGREILTEAGYDAAAMQDLVEAGVVWLP
ncbi:crotonobetainyl-CoA:carnitine CoA-transferase CaiB-like acyl-CoA transferase [Kribbella sp. VKM Ac-2527]|uniref:Crotonobetainyl-CoA:carnitine CoA-transferase CaiB-like acyl-CoA transferase n=1 Tax=Kribbella caucasensis TaxID=2512215 RepID=A0A4R6KK07_9ACTN|nr:CoA transferase [Kribbella sp. VKM Ac-2527]TDO51657.1 crotonobetainyl-CoA:carnitine CoA-transferase CaiB-like acyl-CoA transferase [Kribbella sp. VKM Ac-2527]